MEQLTGNLPACKNKGKKIIYRNFLLTTVPRPTLGPTQLPIQWVPGALFLGVKLPGVKLTTHLHLVPTSRIRGAIPLLLQYAFMVWCSLKAQGQLYLYLIGTPFPKKPLCFEHTGGHVNMYAMCFQIK